MILYRTKFFGFYDESGKLLEKYTKGPGLGFGLSNKLKNKKENKEKD